MRYLLFPFICLGILFFSGVTEAATQSWPASSGTSIGGSLTATIMPSGRGFEPSDVAVVDDRLLVVSDEGDIATMDFTGNNIEAWLTWAGNDQEGVTVVGNVLYILNERYRDVYAYDLSTHTLLRTYDLSPWIAGEDNLGPEALVYYQGQWLVGHSETEEIFAFDLSGDTVTFLGSWNSGAHVRALHAGEDGKLYVMSSGRVVVFEGMTQVADYSLPSGPVGPEGFALTMNCSAGIATAFVAYDSGSVYRYENFPVVCPVAQEPEPEPVTFVGAEGAANGSIVVSYSDGSLQTYQVYAMTTTSVTTVYQYKDSGYLVVIAPYQRRVAVVDVYTGALLASRTMLRKTSVLDAWLVGIVGF